MKITRTSAAFVALAVTLSSLPLPAFAAANVTGPAVNAGIPSGARAVLPVGANAGPGNASLQVMPHPLSLAAPLAALAAAPATNPTIASPTNREIAQAFVASNMATGETIAFKELPERAARYYDWLATEGLRIPVHMEVGSYKTVLMGQTIYAVKAEYPGPGEFKVRLFNDQGNMIADVSRDEDGQVQVVANGSTPTGASTFNRDSVKKVGLALDAVSRQLQDPASEARAFDGGNNASSQVDPSQTQGKEMDGNDVIMGILKAMEEPFKTVKGDFQDLSALRKKNDIDGILRNVLDILTGRESAAMGEGARSQSRQELARAVVGLLCQYGADRGDGGTNVSSENISKVMLDAIQRSLNSSNAADIARDAQWFSLATDIRRKSRHKHYSHDPLRVITTSEALRAAKTRISRPEPALTDGRREVRLSATWRDKLSQLPEDGMGSQLVDIRLKNGKTYGPLSVWNGDRLMVPENVPPFDEKDIVAVTPHVKSA